MHIEVIDRFQDFTRLKERWNAVYEADPEAQFFLSWTWMSKWLEAVRNQWFILAAKADENLSSYVAFFPLRLRTKTDKRGMLYNEITMTGNRSADYTGFICMPELQDRVISAFARHVQTMNWADLNLEFICASDERMRLFLRGFSKEKFEVIDASKVYRNIDVNIFICPYVELEDDWDTYLISQISPNTRQKIRRFLRKVDGYGEFRITHSDANTVSRDLDILLRFWDMKWGPRKGEASAPIQKTVRAMLMHCFESGSLFLPVLWKGDAPLGALAILVDPVKRSLLFYIGGRNETFNGLSPGFVLHAHSIRYAIKNGFATYDFLRGNEAYKYSFNVKERRVRHLVIRTRNGKNLGGKLDVRSLPVVLQLTAQLHRSGRLSEAELGYRQALDIDPQCSGALYGLGRLMAEKGDHDAAERLLKRLVAVQPDSCKAWFRLGEALAARGRFSAAAEAFREVIRRRPEFPAAYDKLGHALRQLGRFDEAAAALETAAGLQPVT